jgi:enamine deaminase RidA (YjgF/YER057c/UK114 family)
MQPEATRAARLVSVTVQPRPEEGLAELCGRLAAQVRAAGATPVHLQAFGRCRVSGTVQQKLRNVFGRLDWPVTWVEGEACGSPAVAGLQMHAFTGQVERIELDGRVAASVFTDGGARQCVVGGLMPERTSLSRSAQTRRTLEQLQAALAKAGFDLGDVVRTWFYLEDILSWYDDFNPVRTKLYSGVKFRTGSLPASTGVGARNPAGAALAVAAWAFQPLEKNAYAEEVASPLQCPAPAYGSSFSRAMEISTNGGRRLSISGTASIAPGGKTMWVGDVRRQVALTMDVVEAILRSRRFGWGDLSRGTAYFRRPADAPVLGEWLAAHGLTNLPVVPAHCDVCRDDLLFELEAEARAGI